MDEIRLVWSANVQTASIPSDTPNRTQSESIMRVEQHRSPSGQLWHTVFVFYKHLTFLKVWLRELNKTKLLLCTTGGETWGEHLGFVLNQTGRTGHLPNRADCVSSMKSDGGCSSLFKNSVNTHNSSSTAGFQIKSSGLFSFVNMFAAGSRIIPQITISDVCERCRYRVLRQWEQRPSYLHCTGNTAEKEIIWLLIT